MNLKKFKMVHRVTNKMLFHSLLAAKLNHWNLLHERWAAGFFKHRLPVSPRTIYHHILKMLFWKHCVAEPAKENSKYLDIQENLRNPITEQYYKLKSIWYCIVFILGIQKQTEKHRNLWKHADW